MTVEHHSFLIRIWRETTKNMAPFGEWQGEIEHIQCGRRWKFDSIDKFLALINVDQQLNQQTENLEDQAESDFLSFHPRKTPGKEK